MKKPEATQHRFQRFAEFLEEERSYLSAGAAGEDTVIDGFQVGECFFTLADMEWLVTAPDEFRVQRLLAASNPAAYEA
jgi:hypothetical protein